MKKKKTEFSETDRLAKTAKECADKLSGVDKIILPLKREVIPPPINNVNVEVYQNDQTLGLAAVLCFASGFVCLGFAIASALK
jgi:hypothetical protein